MEIIIAIIVLIFCVIFIQPADLNLNCGKIDFPIASCREYKGDGSEHLITDREFKLDLVPDPNKLVFDFAFCASPKLVKLKLKVGLQNLTGASLHSGEKLELLELQGNAITILRSHVFKYARQLKEINLLQNEIAQVQDNAFVDLQELHTLNLGHNQIHELRNFTFNGANNLQYLNLEPNKINYIDAAALNLTMLKELLLPNNQIKHLSATLKTDGIFASDLISALRAYLFSSMHHQFGTPLHNSFQTASNTAVQIVERQSK